MASPHKLVGNVLRRRVAEGNEAELSRDLDELVDGPRSEEIPHLLVSHAEFHRVSNWVHLAWRDSNGIRKQIADTLGTRYDRSVLNDLRTLSELNRVSEILDAQEIPWLVVKGPVLAESAYPRFDLRSYSDLDIVIPPPFFKKAIETLEDDGYRLLDSNWKLLVSHLKGELHLVSPRGVVVDAHWNLINEARTRDAFSVQTRTLFENAHEVDLGGVPAPTLAPSDNLVYLTLHDCLSGGERLLWLMDIFYAANRGEVDWSRVVELAEQWHIRPVVALMLDRTARVLSHPIPPERPQRIAGNSFWIQTVRLLDTVSPPETVGVEGSLSRIAARATRSSFLRSSVELIRRSTAFAIDRVTVSDDPDDPKAGRPGSAFTPSGDWRDREDFRSLGRSKTPPDPTSEPGAISRMSQK